jgi:hypothetical protein
MFFSFSLDRRTRVQDHTAWERRVKIAQDFPETVKSTEVYDRLGLDIKKPGDKKVTSRVMRAVGFVARRGRRWAVWEKARDAEKWVEGEGGNNLSSSLLLPHHTVSVTVTPETTM